MLCVVSSEFVKLCAFQAQTRLPSNISNEADTVDPSAELATHNSVLMSVIISSMKIIRTVIGVLALSSIALATSACPEKGPVEKAGEKIDNTIDKTKEAVKEPAK
jgi:hypothetical protein